MRTDNRLKKIRPIQQKNKAEYILGVSLPDYLKEDWNGIYVSVLVSGTTIILQSGAEIKSLEKKELLSYTKKLDVINI